MKNLVLSITSIFLFVLFTMVSCKGKKAETGAFSEQPNIVYIISDDQGWTDYSFMGHEHIETPRIDQLAAEGLTFTYGYSAAPLCRPSLASMATGLYPHQNNIVGNDPVFDFDRGKRWSPEWNALRSELNEPVIDEFGQLPNLAGMLGEKGYVSLQTGKWWEGHYSVGGFTEGMTKGDIESGGRHGDEGLTIGREGLEVIFDFINRAQEEDKPFFIWYAPFLPHAPHTPPDSLLNKYLTLAPTPAVAAYWAMCEWFDITCGQMMDFIDKEGLAENTLFVYVTDNGWIQDPDRPNLPTSRSKLSPYEQGIRTPVIFNWEGTIEPEMDREHLVNSIDIASTILQVCGVTPTEKMQGINVLDTEVLAEREHIFAECYDHDFISIDSSLRYRIILELPWKLILPDDERLPDAPVELFNVFNDPHELTNQADNHPEIVARLTKKIKEWW